MKLCSLEGARSLPSFIFSRDLALHVSTFSVIGCWENCTQSKTVRNFLPFFPPAFLQFRVNLFGVLTHACHFPPRTLRGQGTIAQMVWIHAHAVIAELFELPMLPSSRLFIFAPLFPLELVVSWVWAGRGVDLCRILSHLFFECIARAMTEDY